jgi:hypothetical protein
MTRKGILQPSSPTSPIFTCLNNVPTPCYYQRLAPRPSADCKPTLPDLIAFPLAIAVPRGAQFFSSLNLLLLCKKNFSSILRVAVHAIIENFAALVRKKQYQILCINNAVIGSLVVVVRAITISFQAFGQTKFN